MNAKGGSLAIGCSMFGANPRWRSWLGSTLILLGVLLTFASAVAAQEIRSTLAPAKYDRGTIFTHMSYLFDIPNKDRDPVFVRWERPVRYYLQVPPGHPELIKLFEQQVAEVAKYSGLDIARHDRMYLQYKDESLNDRSTWPKGLNTVAAVFFTCDPLATLHEDGVERVLRGFGIDPSEAAASWQRLQTASPYLSEKRYGFQADGLHFAFFLVDIRDEGGNCGGEKSKSLIAMRTFRVAVDLVLKLGVNDSIPSILNSQPHRKGLRGLTEFDKQLLRVYYGPKVKSGMGKDEAMFIMNEELVRHFAGKAAPRKE